MLLHWPPRFSRPNCNCNFFLWGYVKDLVYVPSLPMLVDNLKIRITEALITINPDMLVRVWQEMEYRFDVCHVTKGILNICEKFNETLRSWSQGKNAKLKLMCQWYGESQKNMWMTAISAL